MNCKKSTWFIFFLFGIGLSSFLIVSPLYAQEQKEEIKISLSTPFSRAKDIKLPHSSFHIEIPTGGISKKTDLSLGVVSHLQDGSPFTADDYLELVSDVYQYGFSSNSALKKPVVVSFPSVSKDTRSVYFFLYDKQIHTWKKITTLRKGKTLSTPIFSSAGVVALFRERSWYENGEVHAEKAPARGVYVVDQQGTVLYSKNENRELSLASLTKLMTALIFLERNPGWDTQLTIQASDDTLPAKVPFHIGDVVRIQDIFDGMLVGSRNNCAKILARASGLSDKEFIDRMNEKARELGLKNTFFADTSGLDSKNTSTVKEYAKIADLAFSSQDIRDSFGKRSSTIPILNDPKKRTYIIKNTDPFLKERKDIVGGKTGYTEEAGYSFIVKAKQDDREVTVLVFGSPDSATRFYLSKILLDKGFARQVVRKNNPKVALKKQ